jgi:hypothetical protein
LYARPDVAAVWGDEIANFKHNPTFPSSPIGFLFSSEIAGYSWNIEFWYRADLTP